MLTTAQVGSRQKGPSCSNGTAFLTWTTGTWVTSCGAITSEVGARPCGSYRLADEERTTRGGFGHAWGPLHSTTLTGIRISAVRSADSRMPVRHCERIRGVIAGRREFDVSMRLDTPASRAGSPNRAGSIT